ncbi:MAG: NAD(P)-dependent alcohol dehydrogenase [Woeseiaceae bacterium]|nr:NAD(P)-dependent alcohol dehydrogenase [Woeseiaceae bacterium]
MKLLWKVLKKIALGLLVVIAAGIAALAVTISYTSECPPPPEIAVEGETMQAVMSRCYGGPEVLSLEDVPKPEPSGNEVLVRVHAAAVNPLDWHYMRGSPYFMRLEAGIGAPSDPTMGVDFAGTVESVGADVTRFEVGDAVFGGRSGAFAEYVLIPEDRAIAHMPDNVSFEQAASLPIAAITALQALRDKGKLQSEQRVLINGASGGVGTFAVQIAESFGAEVHGVCSTRNVEMVTALGADYVFDYTKESYIESGEQYDLIVDMVGNHSPSANLDVLADDGTLVIVGGAKGDWLGPMIRPLQAMIMSPFVDQEMITLLARMNADDLATLADLLESGDVAVQIDRRFSLEEVPEAIRYSETGRARGKIIINVLDEVGIDPSVTGQ